MHDLESYLRRQSTEQLSEIIHDDFVGKRVYSEDTILLVCKILAERCPPCGNAEEMLKEFRRFYFPEQFDGDEEDL